ESFWRPGAGPAHLQRPTPPQRLRGGHRQGAPGVAPQDRRRGVCYPGADSPPGLPGPAREEAHERQAADRQRVLPVEEHGEMTLSVKAAKELVEELVGLRDEDNRSLALLHDYARGHQPHPAMLDGVPPEVQRFVDMSRVNIIDLVVEVLGQSLYVDGYRPNLRSIDA